MHFTDPLIYGFPLFIISVLFEMYISARNNKKNLFYWKDLLASASMGLGATLIGPVAKLLVGLPMFIIVANATTDLRISLLGYESLGWGWYIWILAVFADDFTFYWHHRFSHTIRVLWAAHVVHHSSRSYNLGVGLRNGWVTLFYKPLWWLWMVLIGFEPEMIVVVMAINSVYQFCLHTQSVPSLGIFDHFFNTPYIHQVHHACNKKYLDKNHGGIFVIWDKIFGTYQYNEPEIDPQFGVLSEPGSYNPLVIFSHEYVDIWRDVKSANNWKHKLMYIFGPPGWSPDNSKLTAKQMQRMLEEQEQKEKIRDSKEVVSVA